MLLTPKKGSSFFFEDNLSFLNKGMSLLTMVGVGGQ